jgi:hypothetical protein
MAALNESTPTLLGTFYGGTIFRFAVTNTGPLALTAIIVQGQATPEADWVTLIDANVDVTNLTNILGYALTDDSDDLMHLRPGVTAGIHIDCSTYTAIRILACGPATSTATATFARPVGFPPDLTSDLNGPAGAGLVGMTPGHGLISTDVQGALFELADAIPAPYTLPVATAGVLGGVKGGGNISIAGDGTLSYTPYTLPVAGAALGGVKSGGNVTIDGTGQLTAPTYSLPIAAAGTLGGVKVGSGLAIDGAGVLSVTGGGGTVTSVNGQTPTAGAVTINTSHITENTNLYYTDARVRACVLTGLSLATGTAVTAADSVLVAAGKLQKQITDAIATIPLVATATPLIESGAGAVGTATKFAREDHVHPASAGGGALVLLATINTSAVATLNALTAFTAGYDNILIIGNGIDYAASDSMRFRLAVSGAAVSTSVYADSGISSPNPGSWPQDAQNFGHINAGGDNTNSTYRMNFELRIYNVTSTAYTKHFEARAWFHGASAGGPIITTTYPGCFDSTSVVTGIQFYSEIASNFSTGGVIRIYGIKNT